MDKIKQLLKEMGASEEFTKALCEELENYVATQKKSLEEDFQARLQKAKKVCIEEVDKEKQNLARKVEIFLESKQRRIEEAIGEQRAIEESESVNKLKALRATLEGVPFDEKVQEEIAALKEEISNYKKTMKTITEERDIAVDKANRANKVATRVLRRHRDLLGEDAGAGTSTAGVAEGVKKDEKGTCEGCKKTPCECACKECKKTPCECASAGGSIKEGELPEALKRHQFKKEEEKKEEGKKEGKKEEAVSEEVQQHATGGTQMDQPGKGVQPKDLGKDDGTKTGGKQDKTDQPGKGVQKKSLAKDSGGGKKEGMQQDGKSIAEGEVAKKVDELIDISIEGTTEAVEESVKQVVFGEDRVRGTQPKTTREANAATSVVKRPESESDSKIRTIANMME